MDKRPIIGIDASRANAAERTGTEWYAYNVIQGLKKVIPADFRVVLYSKEALRDGLEELPAHWEGRVLGWPPRKLWTQLRLSWEMLRRPPDVLFVPAHALPILLPKKALTTLHDVAFMAVPEAYGATERIYHRFAARFAVERAAVILTVSDFSKREIVRHFGADADKIAVTHLGFDKETFHPAHDKDAAWVRVAKLGITDPYFIYVGRLEAKKNLSGLLAAFREYRRENEGDLVLVGKRGVGYDAAMRELDGELGKSVHELGYVAAEDMRYLYSAAEALVFPTLYEGFGLPVLEAFSCGTPVIASEITSIPEVGGHAVRYIDPRDVSGIAGAMHQVRHDQELRERLVSAGFQRAAIFSWENTAAMTWKAMRRLLE